MSIDTIQYAFAAGEISPTLIGRSDLEKYDLGLARAENWFVDYRGGLSTRPGTRFVDYLQCGQQPTKFVRFQFGTSVLNTAVIVFAQDRIRFIQNGAYVLEDDVDVTDVSSAAQAVITAPGHGFANEDWIKLFEIEGPFQLNTRTFRVKNVTTDTFEIVHPVSQEPIATDDLPAYTAGGVAARIYTIASPYPASDLDQLRAYQIRDFVRLTHPDHPIRNLIRDGLTDWSFELEEAIADVEVPSGLVATPSAGGSSGAVFGVTAIAPTGEESRISSLAVVTNSVNYTTQAGSLRLEWNPVPGVDTYYVYRSIFVPDASDLSRAQELGYLGTSFGPIFVDNNIIPDFTVSPPEQYNPFANGAVRTITVTAPGSGYADGDLITLTDPDGTGFVGTLIVAPGGTVIGVRVNQGGSGYTNPTVNISGSGTGATFDIELSSLTGNNPAVATVFQQRQMYAGTRNQPLTVWGSRPGLFNNFSASAVVADNDSYEFDIDSDVVTPILHLEPMRGGLLILAQAGVWQLQGPEAGSPVTPTQALADPQSYSGVSFVPPIKFGQNLLYIEDKSSVVQLLRYNEISRVYTTQDVSILSTHLFAQGNIITRWALEPTPYNIIWAVRRDGTFLSFTLVDEQNVFAWTPHSTKGRVKDVLTLQEDDKDVTYLAVDRQIDGCLVRMIEQFAPREPKSVEDSWAVDAGLTNDLELPDVDLTISGIEGTVDLTASDPFFISDDEGSFVRAAGGLFEVTEYVSDTLVRAFVRQTPTEITPQDPDNTVFPVAEGDWSIAQPFSTFSGLEHLEGQEVAILADGSVLPNQVVENGQITLQAPATKVVVGLPYRCLAQTLPPIISDVTIEARRKRVVGLGLRLYDSRGLKVGSKLDDLYEMKERTTESYGDPVRLQRNNRYYLVNASFNENGQTFIVQDNPLPATVLNVIVDMEVGDDKN